MSEDDKQEEEDYYGRSFCISIFLIILFVGAYFLWGILGVIIITVIVVIIIINIYLQFSKTNKEISDALFLRIYNLELKTTGKIMPNNELKSIKEIKEYIRIKDEKNLKITEKEL